MMRENTTPRAMYVAGWLLIAFVIFDTVIKLIDLAPVRETLSQMGYRPALGPTIGVIELLAMVIYVFPRTAVLGAILLTAVFGGAVACHMRIGSPLLGFTLFGV